jgi:hypothetical protein
VYVLSKRPEAIGQQLIEVPGQLEEPEVFFVNYNEGENPVLPGGIDLQTALSQSAGAGRIIDASGGAGLGGGVVGGVGHGGGFDVSNELIRAGGFSGGFSGNSIGSGGGFNSGIGGGNLKGSYSSPAKTVVRGDQAAEGSSVVTSTLKQAVEEPSEDDSKKEQE